MSNKFLNVRVDNDLHKSVKIEATKKGLSLQEYIIELLKEKLNLKEKPGV